MYRFPEAIFFGDILSVFISIPAWKRKNAFAKMAIEHSVFALGALGVGRESRRRSNGTTSSYNIA